MGFKYFYLLDGFSYNMIKENDKIRMVLLIDKSVLEPTPHLLVNGMPAFCKTSGLTTMIYAIAKKVVIPARISVLTFVPCSLSLKNLLRVSFILRPQTVNR